MIDSHCHLNFESIQKDILNVISNAKKNNIKSILSINTNPNDFESHYELIKKYNSIFISYGLHPQEVNDNNLILSKTILEYTKIDKVIGIGETGLDFYHSIKFKKEQYKVFHEHIEASISSNLPLIIHQRNSENEIIEVLNQYIKNHNLKIVFHCFTGSDKLKKFCIDNNFYISISGIITFNNANDLRNNIRDMPIDLLLIETDSPFLSPEPMRGKKNEPSYVKFVAEYLADFYDMPIKTFIKYTDDNFYKLFSKAIRYNEISQ